MRVSTAEYAARHGMGPEYVRDLCRAGRFEPPAFKEGGVWHLVPDAVVRRQTPEERAAMYRRINLKRRLAKRNRADARERARAASLKAAETRRRRALESVRNAREGVRHEG